MTTLQTVVREQLSYTATKSGCKQGGCGSCTVLVDGVPMLSCVLPIEDVAGKAVTTSLQITYRVPMHVGEEIQAEGYIVRRQSRGALAKGEIRRADNKKILATAESRHVFFE